MADGHIWLVSTLNQIREAHRYGRSTLLTIAALASCVAIAGCSFLQEEASYKFKMIVEAETPQGIRTGSAIMRVHASKNVRLTAHEHQGGAAVHGEAVILDGPKGPVFVLPAPDLGAMGRTWLAVQVTKAFEPSVNSLDAADFLRTVRILNETDNVRTAFLSRKDWPVMVRFENIDDPASVEIVEPEEIGVRQIKLTTSRNPLTCKIDRWLQWLPARAGGNIVNDKSSLGYRINSISFRFDPSRDCESSE